MTHEDKPPVKPARPSSEWGAKGEVATLIIAGLLLAVVGGVIAYAAWPAQEVVGGFADAAVEETGSAAWALVGGVVALAGQVMAAIGIVAAGVRLGQRP